MMDARPTTIAVAGAGVEAEQAARTLRGVELTDVTRFSGASDEELLEQLSRDDLDAIAFVTPATDLAGAVRRALMANRHVLVIGPAALSAKQLVSLDDLARRRSRVVFIDAGYACDERLAFVRKMTAPSAALWRPRYVRAMRSANKRHGLDDLAIAEIACVLSIMGGAPSHVSAVAPRIDDETGHSDAAMLTMTFDGGPVATVHVSLVEPMPRRETVIACDGRTIVMDGFDVRAPLQIQATGRHRGPQAGRAWSETISEYPASPSFDREASVAATFIAAVRARDVGASNVRDMALAAATWECARGSMARGGELHRLPSDAASDRPELQVIVGGGNASDARETPSLTVVHSAS
jgi:predicted dehydrogenase